MFRLSVMALLALVIPSVAHAQSFVPYCVDPSGGPWTPGERCVQPLVAPPTGVPAWLEPRPSPQRVPVPPPAVIAAPPAPVYVAPAPRASVMDPWLLHALRPAPARQSPLDVMTQLLLLEQLAAARRQSQAIAPPSPPAVVPPPSATGDGWMSAYIKGVK